MTRRRLANIAFVLVLAATPGCQHLGAKAVPPPASPAEQATEITGLELTSRNPQASDGERAEALRRLALLYLAPENPARNLALAAKSQAAYLQLQTQETARQEGEIWLALLREALESEQLLQQQTEKIREQERTLAGFGAEKQRLAQKIAAQEAVNAKLKADIEKLKSIDLSVEMKRKSFR